MSTVDSTTMTLAGTADPFAFVPMCVRFIESVSVNAMGSGRIQRGWRRTAHGVYRSAYRFQMFWVNARRVTTEMVKGQSIGDRPHQMFVGPSMSHDRGMTLPSWAERSMPTVFDLSRPNPTGATLLDFCPEAQFRVDAWSPLSVHEICIPRPATARLECTFSFAQEK